MKLPINKTITDVVKFRLLQAIALLAFALAQVDAEEEFSPFKLDAKYFKDASVKNKMEFEHSGNLYRIKKTSGERGLYLKHKGSWKKHGVFYYYSGDKLRQKLSYELGKKEGEQLKYFTSGKVKGQVEERYYCKNGLREGSWEDYREVSGGRRVLDRAGTYVKGEKEGLEEVYYATGQVHYKKPYEDGKLHGTILQYSEKGRLDYRTQFERGKQIGQAQWVK